MNPLSTTYTTTTTTTKPTSRRPPFANAVNHNPNHLNFNHAAFNAKALPKVPAPPPTNAAEKKQPGSPPLSRQTTKAIPPSPPRVIKDARNSHQYQKVGFLGEGGFARVYEIMDLHGNRLACKVLSKTSLQSKKAKTKLWAEIKIHRSLTHPNIVEFHDCFEDDENVYISLELCSSGSLMDMLRRRRRFTEPEARYYIVQIIGACHYMHTHQVIHRDLKLGNILLDSNMNIKVADFGLAALIENPGERKKTICGTPNYIAPEVLFDTANGHSFEVDTWSVGVMLYTLLIGRPPFQTKEVKTIYKRIRDNDYDFPAERPISSHARTLIQAILTPDPNDRPSLHEIIDHPFFVNGLVPGYIPITAHDTAPDFRHVTRVASEQNLLRLRRDCLLDSDTSIKLPTKIRDEIVDVEDIPNHVGVSVPTGSLGKSITSSLAQQEKEFQKAVQPGSPISALLSSARQPLLVSNNATHHRGEPLIRKLQAAARESPLAKSAKSQAAARDVRARGVDDEEELARKKLVESQKARIVAQMAPVRESDEEDDDDMLQDTPKVQRAAAKPVRLVTKAAVDQENIPPAMTHASRGTTKRQDPLRSSTMSVSSALKQSVSKASTSSVPSPATSDKQVEPRMTTFDSVLKTLTVAFDAKAADRVFRDPREDPSAPFHEEDVFIVSWVDYCNKYGMGYALTDGTMGVYFNDSTTMVLSPDKKHFDFLSARNGGKVYVRKSHTVDDYPPELKSKLYLLNHFDRYIMDRLYTEADYTRMEVEKTKGMAWIPRYLRMKHVVVFQLSHDVIQFNFNDHTKVILSSQGLLVSLVDKNHKLTHWPLRDLMATSIRIQSVGRTQPAPSGTGTVTVVEGMEPEEVKLMTKLVEKLKYCKEILLSIKNASNQNDGTAPSVATTESIASTRASTTSSVAPSAKSSSRTSRS
ncbi:hypothetical protein ONZ45_g4587 [Pleurotus djamor]|nr:hypothetical protein ONZ45_g4587 [Pleurotus djamor]